MKLADVPEAMIEQFKGGYVPIDEPPGLEEMAYKAWKDSGGMPLGVVCPTCGGSGDGEINRGPDPCNEPCATCYGIGRVPS